MSYCRFSSDNWKCDVYCYANVSGAWTTHVASNKHVGDAPDDRWADFISGRITAEEFAVLHKAQMAFLENAERKPLGLPYDGKSFDDGDAQGMIDRLTHLKSVGYNVPEYVFETLREEVANSV